MAFTLSGDVATTRTNLGLGDAATKTTGTASGNIPVLDSSGQIADAQIAALSVSKLSGVGTTGQVLTSTGTTTAPTMQDAAGGGKVLQVLQNTYKTKQSSSTNYGYDFMSLSITPSSTTSKILIMTMGVYGTSDHGVFQLWKDGSALSNALPDALGSSPRGISPNTHYGSDIYQNSNLDIKYLDAPNTTSAVAYSVRSTQQGSTIYFGGTYATYNNANTPVALCTITLMEIGA